MARVRSAPRLARPAEFGAVVVPWALLLVHRVQAQMRVLAGVRRVPARLKARPQVQNSVPRQALAPGVARRRVVRQPER